MLDRWQWILGLEIHTFKRQRRCGPADAARFAQEVRSAEQNSSAGRRARSVSRAAPPAARVAGLSRFALSTVRTVRRPHTHIIDLGRVARVLHPLFAMRPPPTPLALLLFLGEYTLK